MSEIIYDGEIKPCPFCGQEAHVEEHEWEHDCGYEATYEYTVGCCTYGCWAQADTTDAFYRSAKGAVEIWNMREGDFDAKTNDD